MRTLAALILASLAAPAAAQGFTDPASGFAVNPKPPFVAEQVTRKQFDVGVGLKSTTGFPPIAGSGEHVCVAGFKFASANETYSQDEINAFMRKPAWRELVRATISLVFLVTAVREARIGGVRGLELEARPTSGPDHQNARLFFAIHETPKGRMTMVCSTKRDAWSKAVRDFRALRATISMPK